MRCGTCPKAIAESAVEARGRADAMSVDWLLFLTGAAVGALVMLVVRMRW
jgi:hypothetical protein